MIDKGMNVVVVAEKPSVARDIAKVLGATSRGNGFFHGNDYQVTWAVGHLVALAQPHEIDPAWKAWRRELLPMLPQKWPLQIIDKTRDQYQVIDKLINSSRTKAVVCATDAGREGELIFRYIYERARCQKTVKRLWISSLTHEAIKRGFNNLSQGDQYDPLAASAKGRSRADWLVGMNLSRAYSIGCEDTYSVGRVQTPTLAMLVERTTQIKAFVPEDYLEVSAFFSGSPGSFEGVYFIDKDKATRLDKDRKEAKEIVDRALSGQTEIESVKKEEKRWRVPLLYDLTELQRHANRLFGFSAARTLELAQNLYERHKLISYPRTDSRHLTEDVAREIGPVIEAIKEPYQNLMAPQTGQRKLPRRFVNDAKVGDHHAIIPTTVDPGKLSAGSAEAKIYDLICRRLLAAWHDDHITSITTVITQITNDQLVDRYRSCGTVVEQIGWRVMDLPFKKKKTTATALEQELPAGLAGRLGLEVTDAKAKKKKTRAPKPYTEATLLTGMETAGKTLDDKELSSAMRECGLGTPATRAATIETLLDRKYIERKAKALWATDKGISLIERVHEHVKSPAMTGNWERRLRKIERKEDDLGLFMKDIEQYVAQVVGSIGQSPVQSPKTALINTPHASARKPVSPENLHKLLRDVFGLDQFRAHQSNVCRAVTEGKDVLLVMPTGAGKSLCYQLPGIARAGTTLVISPLIALMEDQVAGLVELGFKAQRIHSGRNRVDSRRVCRQYLDGELDFLFIAPERLGVPGFPEMLAKRKPVLIAVDEAHCISHWGHDFRPDYRMLKSRLPLLLPTPIIGLTATATPLVQDDIIVQLGLVDGRRFIHGFRRTNIAIEIAELSPADRPDAILKVLKNQGRLPAIVYAPTRKKAEQLAEHLNSTFSVAAYHAGMSPNIRDRVQSDFLSGTLDVIVATIAFGMGIDKSNIRTVIHAALPGSIEGYYQEIGRAGRDGLLSRAILMHSWADRRTHEFFHDRNYPDHQVLEKMYGLLTDSPKPKQMLGQHLGLDDEMVDKVLEKLWIHGGALVDPEERVCRGENRWKGAYMEQQRYKLEQLHAVTKFVTSTDCRMLRLVNHFGDQEDSGKLCGHCDICQPKDNIAINTRAPGETEVDYLQRILRLLKMESHQAKGKLYRSGFEGVFKRPVFEKLVEALVRAGLVDTSEDSFEKDDRVIEFVRLNITSKGMELAKDKKAICDLVRLIDPPGTKKKKPRKQSKKRNKKSAPTANPPSPQLMDALKNWRLELARKRKIPAFRILTDRVIGTIAAENPKTEDDLLQISGFGPTLLKKYGAQILRICKDQ